MTTSRNSRSFGYRGGDATPFNINERGAAEDAPHTMGTKPPTRENELMEKMVRELFILPDQAERAIAIIKGDGYVKLASDQINLPEPNLNAHTSIVMFKAGWRKVESEL